MAILIFRLFFKPVNLVFNSDSAKSMVSASLSENVFLFLSGYKVSI